MSWACRLWPLIICRYYVCYVHVCLCNVHSFQYRLKPNRSHKTAIIMSLKRVTSGTWGPSSRVPTSFPPLPPCDSDNILSAPNNLPIPRPLSKVWVCGCGCDGGVNRWRPSENGWGMFWMGNLPPFLTEYLGVCPSPSGPRGTARTGEMKWEQVVVCRLGEEFPCRSCESTANRAVWTTPSQQEARPPARSSWLASLWIHNKKAVDRRPTLHCAVLTYFWSCKWKISLHIKQEQKVYWQ